MTDTDSNGQPWASGAPHGPGLTPAEVGSLVSPPPRRRTGRLIVVGVVLAVLVGTSLAAALALKGGDAVGHPAAWDPRVQPFVDFVEKHEHATFDHPVAVDFLDNKAFLAQSRPDDIDHIGQDRTAIEGTVSMLRVLGLVTGDPDLYNSQGQLRGFGVNGYYSYVDQRIRIRGTELTPATRFTLVHVLTHALQDQEFDLGARLGELSDDPSKAGAFRAVLEGDTSRIQTLWRASLDKPTRRSLDEQIKREGLPSDTAAQIPVAFRTMVGAPLSLGEPLLDVVLLRGGPEAMSSLLLTPPSTQEHLLDPWTLVTDHQGYLTVAAPELATGEDRVGSGTFGAITWLVMLSERISPRTALEAVDGWGGDAYVTLQKEGQSCVRVDYKADTARDLGEMDAALTTWARRGPKGAASVVKEGQVLHFESCADDASTDGSTVTSTGTGGSREALQLAIARTRISVELLDTGLDVDVARCGADRLVDSWPLQRLADIHAASAQVAAVVNPCRPTGTG